MNSLSRQSVSKSLLSCVILIGLLLSIWKKSPRDIPARPRNNSIYDLCDMLHAMSYNFVFVFHFKALASLALGTRVYESRDFSFSITKREFSNLREFLNSQISKFSKFYVFEFSIHAISILLGKYNIDVTSYNMYMCYICYITYALHSLFTRLNPQFLESSNLRILGFLNSLRFLDSSIYI